MVSNDDGSHVNIFELRLNCWSNCSHFFRQIIMLLFLCSLWQDLLLPLPQLRQHKIRGMIEFSGEDEEKVIKYLITDMNPKSMAEAIPGLPAHILFMCIRHCDHVNDDRRMQSLLTNSINSIRKVVKVNSVSDNSYIIYCLRKIP